MAEFGYPISKFYQEGCSSDELTLQGVIKASRYYVGESIIYLQRPRSIDEAVISGLIEEAYEHTHRLVSDDQNYTFETATINSNATGGDVVIAGTYSSSLTGNPGNVYELATKAASDPSHRYTYVALPGNGYSSPLTRKERRHFLRSGSFLVKEEGVTTTLPVVRALAEVLRSHDVLPKHLASDSAGGVLMSALGANLPKNKVETVFQNVRPGFSDMSSFMLAKGMLIDDGRLAAKYKDSSPDPWKVDESAKALVLAHKPEGFEPPHVPMFGRVAMLGSYARGLSIGKRGDKYPLWDDTVALLERQGDAHVRFVCEQDDVLMTEYWSGRRLRSLVRGLSYFTSKQVDLVLVENGYHSLHTYYPQFVDAMRLAMYTDM